MKGLMKAALVMALVACVSAIALAAGNAMPTGGISADRNTTTPDTLTVEEPQGIYKHIEQELHCPDFIESGGQKVELWVRVNPDGSLLVLRIRSQDARLKKYVMERLNGRSLDLPADEVGRNYHFAIRFLLV